MSFNDFFYLKLQRLHYCDNVKLVYISVEAIGIKWTDNTDNFWKSFLGAWGLKIKKEICQQFTSYIFVLLLILLLQTINVSLLYFTSIFLQYPYCLTPAASVSTNENISLQW